ncbi:hypothetical protein HYDPIDRAFT_84801 [Hydnomerulius pinastri MD-312]|nr:hypothetical protein HYDPIDRAFT_84801 [Hydnomerulius pinastri MD-312]
MWTSADVWDADRSGSQSRFGTLSSLSSSSGPGGPPRPPMPMDDDDDESDGEPKEGESWFAGGERSGISVQNPNARGNAPGGRMVQDILRRAAECRGAQSAAPEATSSAFRGGGHMLGSDEVESSFIPDPNAPEEEDEEDVQRNITFWRNGFSIEGGEFYSYADPANERLLAEINTGRAPVSVLNVRPGQPVEVIVSKRTNEDYVPEMKPVVGFSGSGNRLGSPVPVATSSSSSTPAPMPGSFPTSSGSGETSGERANMTTMFEVDQSQPTTTVQIRLADGTRMPCRMNLMHTVGDIRSFINASRPENMTRPYTIGTTFPNRTLENDRETIKDAGLVNSVIVQRWV